MAVVEGRTFTLEVAVSASAIIVDAGSGAPFAGEVTELTFPECEELGVLDTGMAVLVDDNDPIMDESVDDEEIPVPSGAPVEVSDGGTEEIDVADMDEVEDKDVS